MGQVMPGRAVAVELEDGPKALTAVAGMETLVSMRTLDSGGDCAVSGGRFNAQPSPLLCVCAQNKPEPLLS